MLLLILTSCGVVHSNLKTSDITNLKHTETNNLGSKTAEIN